MKTAKIKIKGEKIKYLGFFMESKGLAGGLEVQTVVIIIFILLGLAIGGVIALGGMDAVQGLRSTFMEFMVGIV